MAELHIPRTLPEGASVIPLVRNAIAVASSKGGVGKSTVCINTALSMARMGASVGLLDADIYGPSVQLMTGIQQQPEITSDSRLLPVEAHGMSMMSMGFIADENTPVVWRGPLLAQAVQQFLGQVEWGELDFLFLDLPPGTGDIPLTLSQAIALSGVVIVTTPQEVALEDVGRGIAMFEKVDVDVLGLVENMSYYLCPHCSERHEIFGHGGGRAFAERLGIEYLGELPMDADIRRGGDEGTPIVIAAPESSHAQAFADLASRILTITTELAQPGPG